MDLSAPGLDSATLTAIILQSTWCGLYSLAFFQCVWKMWRRIEDVGYIIAALTLLYLLVLSHWALSLYDTFQAFVGYRFDPGTVQWIMRTENNYTLIRVLIFYVAYALSSGIVIWRLYFVWSRSWWACMPAVLAVALGAGLGGVDIMCEVLKANSKDGTYTGMNVPWHVVAFSANIFVSIVLTTMMAGRHWWIRKSSLRTSLISKMKTFVLVGVDSAALYPLVLVGISIAYALERPNVLWASSFVMPVAAGLTPTLLLLCLDFSRRRAWQSAQISGPLTLEGKPVSRRISQGTNVGRVTMWREIRDNDAFGLSPCIPKKGRRRSVASRLPHSVLGAHYPYHPTPLSIRSSTMRKELTMAAYLVLQFVGAAIAVPTSDVSSHANVISPPPEEPETPVGTGTFWLKLGLSAVLVLLGGAFAGLTIGLMGLDPLYLRVLATSSDDPAEKLNAQKVLKLMRKGRHWVLVVLLLGNVIVNESLPIFLDSAIGGGIAAVLISTAAIVVFGEIIPQAVCARYGLTIGAKSAPMVLVLMYLLAPIAYPIAKVLDYVLGEEEQTTYKKAELKSFLQFHRNPVGTVYGTSSSAASTSDRASLPLSDEEISILNGVLSLNEKSVKQIMTPMEDVVTLSSDQVMDHRMVDYILTSGYSRFPVHEPNRPFSFIGFLLVKRLLLYDPAKPKKVGQFSLVPMPEARPSINCFQALDYFQTGRAHLLLITEAPGQPYGALGVVTLEDIIEEIISEEIVDETDVYEDMHTKRRAKRQSTAAVMKGIVEREERKRRNSQGTIPRSISSVPNTPQLGPTALLPGTPGKTNGSVGEMTRLLPAISEAGSASSESGSHDDRTMVSGNGIPYSNGHTRSDYGSTAISESPTGI